MKPFQYYSPADIQEAVSLLSNHRGEARILAGGTDLINRMNRGEISPKYLISLRGIKSLQFITQEDGVLRMGAGTNLRAVETSPVIKSLFPVLAEAAGQIGSIQVRNRGTIGGNLINAAPSADMAAPLLALNARAIIIGQNRRNEIPLQALFTGPGTTSLEDDELLQEIVVPVLSKSIKAVYYKLSPRRAMDIATVGVAVCLGRQNEGLIDHVAIALGAVAPVPMRAERAEQLLRNQSLSLELIDQAGSIAAEEASPISDHRASAGYRKEMVKVLVKRGLLETGGEGVLQ